MLKRAMPTFLRHSSSGLPFLIAAVVAAASAPPPVVNSVTAPVAHALWLAYVYWSSMLIGAVPYIAAGSLAASAAGHLQSICERTSRSVAARLRYLTPLSAMLFSGCDCTLVSYAAALRDAPPWMSGFALTWSACCSPIALFCTARILGGEMMLTRLSAGFAAASLTAIMWTRTGRATRALARYPNAGSHACGMGQHSVTQYIASGLQSFGLAAVVAALFLACGQGGLTAHGSTLVAALTGALMSPCSSSDAVVARVLFRPPEQQIAFILAAQCLDFRQLYVLRKYFGSAAAVTAGCSAALILGCICLVITTRHA